MFYNFHRTLAVTVSVLALLAAIPGASVANGGLGLQMNGAVGATVINGQSYQFFSFRPEVSVGKLGVGFDLSLYFDADGKVRKEDWDEAGDIIEKIYYVRWGHPNDLFYVRAGSLAPITLGYGLMMRRYTNAIEWPSVRRIGAHVKINPGDLGAEAVVGNFREIGTPGLVAARVTLDLKLILATLRFGGNIIHDGNQYLGAKDNDDDGVPDRIDMFPDKDDYRHADELRALLTAYQIQRLIEMGDLPDFDTLPPRINDLRDPVTAFGIDVGMPLMDREKMSLWIYAQAAQIVDFGRGYGVPGVIFTLGPFHAGAEYRIFEAEFLGDYFDMAYETERVTWDDSAGVYRTRESLLKNLPSANGIWADAGMTFLNMLEVYGSYSHMSFDGLDPIKSLYASASLKGKLIPKISTAQAYFQQPNATKLFNTDADGTVVGYKVGYEIGPGVSLIYDNKAIYHNGKPTRIMTIETALTF